MKISPSLQSILNQDSLWVGTGILPSQAIRKCRDTGIITTSYSEKYNIQDRQIQPASIDLRLGPVGYELRASFLPGIESSIAAKLNNTQLRAQVLDLTNGVTLQPEHVYLVELIEELHLPFTITAKANPRSTSGRVDLFTRLVCDFTTEFDEVPAGYDGKLYAEIVPRTFPIRVKCGTRVNQLRFGHVTPSYTYVPVLGGQRPTVPVVKQQILTIDLRPEDNSDIIGYKAKKWGSHVLEFDCVACHSRFDFWEPIRVQDLSSVILEPDDFYIFRSCEKVKIEPTLAAELSPYDSSLGEFRVHYAGFLDPGFGWSKEGHSGTPVVLEMRARDVPFIIEHGQPIALLNYYALLEAPDVLYGESILESSYQDQGIALGKQFKSLE